jgi:murein DD-endopeptidase MepM/ murein hydrolase activator NlpD
MTGVLGSLVLITGCMPQPSIPPTPTKTPNVAALTIQPDGASLVSIPTLIPPTTTPSLVLPTLSPESSVVSASPTSETAITLTPTDTLPPPTQDDDLPPDHYWMVRPIPQGWTDYLDRTYAYGSTSGGQFRPHTGAEFWNPASTPVIAVGNAAVFYAGTDWETLFGPNLSFYGNLIVLQLSDYTLNGRPVFAIYGHLSEIYFNTGDTVNQGEIIGAVGGTGAANGGPHLHFEVRLDDPHSYFSSTRNPDLWIRPYFGYGTLAGRVLDGAGNRLAEVSFTIRGSDAVRYTWSYAGVENRSDDAWGENFTYGDLPEGWYTITTRSSTRTYSEEFYIRPGRTTWVEFVFD